MKIRTKLILIALLPVILLLSLAVIFFLVTRQVEQANYKATQADDITKEFNDLSILTYEYHIYSRERVHRQWLQKYEELGGMLREKGREFDTPEEREAIARVLKSYRNIGYLFEQYGTHHRSETTAAAQLTEEQKNFRERITSRLLQELAEAGPASDSLHDLNHGRALSLSREIDRASMLFVGFIAVLIPLIVAFIVRSFSVPVKVLQEAVSRISGGALSYRINSRSQDEIGELSRTFDLMAERLLESDEALRSINRELEERVGARTAELTLSNAQLKNEVAERIAAEADLKKFSVELERSNRELEHFAYVASHDLQEPLRKIASFTELLAKKYSGQLDEKAGSYMHFIVDGAHRMQALINDLLSFSRATSRGKPFEPVDSGRLLQRVLADIELLLRERGAQVHAGELPVVYADAAQLGLVFQNLIGNAVKYCSAGVAPEITLSATHADREWTFSVRDNGIGINPQYFDRIFLLFQRLHTKEEYSGTGIGLAIVKKIIERHGGRIWVESAAGSGATFYFTIADQES